jgi:hypothetical protein
MSHSACIWRAVFHSAAIDAIKDAAPKAGDLKWKRGNPTLGLTEARPETESLARVTPEKGFLERKADPHVYGSLKSPACSCVAVPTAGAAAASTQIGISDQPHVAAVANRFVEERVARGEGPHRKRPRTRSRVVSVKRRWRGRALPCGSATRARVSIGAGTPRTASFSIGFAAISRAMKARMTRPSYLIGTGWVESATSFAKRGSPRSESQYGCNRSCP